MIAAYAYILAIIIAWGAAHIIKYAGSRIRREQHSFAKHLFMSGGMPSSHSAIVIAVTTVIGLNEGFDSGLFGLAAALSLVVTYDAAHVRRMAGQTAEILHARARTQKEKLLLPIISRGHTPLEVAAGVVLGVVVGLVVFLATK